MKEANKPAKLRRERERRGWSRAYVAEKTESDLRTVGRWERSEYFPDAYHLQKLCELFNMLPEELGLLRETFEDSSEHVGAEPMQLPPSQPVVSPPSMIVEEKATISPAAPFNYSPDVLHDNGERTSYEEHIAGAMTHPLAITRRKKRRLRRVVGGSLAVLVIVALFFTYQIFALRIFSSRMASTASCQAPTVMAPIHPSPTLVSSPSPQAVPAVGSISFGSSGQLAENSNQGMNDVVQIDLHHIPAPAVSRHYYAWLSNGTGQSEPDSFPLGLLRFQNGEATLTYSDPQHTNLLAEYNSLLITEEVVNAPGAPSLNPQQRKYYAQVSEKPIPNDPNRYSLLDHLRHLLALDPTMAKVGLRGGLDVWLARDSEEVFSLTESFKDDWDTKKASALHSMIICILDYLDGSSYVKTDVPPGTPMLLNPSIAIIGLLYGTPVQNLPGSLSHTQKHLQGVFNSPGATAEQQDLAIETYNDLDGVSNLLTNVRQIAKQLVMMSSSQLLQPSAFSLLQDMATQARYAYTGQPRTVSNQANAGISQIYMTIQHLATLDIEPCGFASNSAVCGMM